MECVAILDLSVALGLEGVPAAARALFTRAAMMLSKLEAGPADVYGSGGPPSGAPFALSEGTRFR